MNSKELNFLWAIYGQEQIPYYYFKDRYAFQLLSYLLEEEGQKVSAIKKSPWAFLLEKPSVKKHSASLKGNSIYPRDLRTYLSEEIYYFDLTFDIWGTYKKHRNDSWFQTSRPGFNLVLQLNFGSLHDRAYYKLIQPKEERHPFRWICHPVASNNKLTMAWARLDIDLENGVALIEEIQNDWFRRVNTVHRNISRMVKNKFKGIKQYPFFQKTNCSPESFFRYSEKVTPPYQKIWQEAMMSASLYFIREELGIRDIYYHSHEGGKRLKYCNPPRSIYTSLPRKFGFQLTERAPDFIRDCTYLKKKLRQNSIQWHRLEL